MPFHPLQWEAIQIYSKNRVVSFKKDKGSNMPLHFYFPTILTIVSEVNDHPVNISNLSFSIFVNLLLVCNFQTLPMKIFCIYWDHNRRGYKVQNWKSVP